MVKHITYSFNNFRALHEALNDSAKDEHGCDDLRPAAELAFARLAEVFKRHSQFNEDWLSDMSNGAYERLLSQLLKWLGELSWYAGEYADSDVKTLKARNAQTCRASISALMQDGNWVFVKIIRSVKNLFHENVHVLTSFAEST
jgi:hypothetical protein